MPVTHHSIEFSGEVVGRAISLGTRYVFYTTHRRLLSIDGVRFGTLVEVRTAVTTALTLKAQDDPRGEEVSEAERQFEN